MAESKSRWISRQVRFVWERLREGEGLPFQDVLSSEMLQEVLLEMGAITRESLEQAPA